MIYLLTAIGLSPGGSSTVHSYTQTVHRTIQNKQYIEQHNNLWECGPCPVLASYTLAFALQLRKKHGKTSVRVATSKNTWNTSDGNGRPKHVAQSTLHNVTSCCLCSKLLVLLHHIPVMTVAQRARHVTHLERQDT